MTIGKARAGRDLLQIIWPFVVVVMVQALVAGASVYTLSAVRAYVGGESSWSKGQKDAIYYLDSFAHSRKPIDFERYEASIAVPLADRDARIALDAGDGEAAARGFAGGGIHEDDISSLIWLYWLFRDVSYIDKAVGYWKAADPLLLEMRTLGDEIRSAVRAGPIEPAMVGYWSVRIDYVNARITPLAVGFSAALGEGSRFVKNVLLAANVATAALLILLAFLRTRKMLRQRMATEARLEVERERVATTLASIGDAVFTTDADGRLDYMNAAAEELTGWRSADASGAPLCDLFRIIDEENKTGDETLMLDLARGIGPSHAGSLSFVRPDMATVAVSLAASPLTIGGAFAGAVVVIHDRTREQDYVNRLAWQASHDSLTGLANRRAFESQLEKAIGELGRKGPGHAMMFLDLDQFKIVNDTCGHAAGDDLLRIIAGRLGLILRPQDMLARLGGDEFGVLLRHCDAGEAGSIAEKLRTAVADGPFAWQDRSFTISASIGLVRLEDPDTSLGEVMKAADMACYMAKEHGRNRVEVHHPSDQALQRRFGEMAWIHRIRDAIDEDRLLLYAQRIAPLGEGCDDGRHVEILLRLQDRDGGIVPPSAFIPPAERYGLMPTIDRWVVRKTFSLLAAHRASGSTPAISTCAINLSGASFGDAGFVDFVTRELASAAIAAETICFEITETSAIGDLSRAICFIEALRGLGCRFALDDFGAGMSSFAYLKNLPVDYLKIDGSFVKDILVDRTDRAMVEMIARLGQITGKKTIAEFVEDDAIAQELRRIGVDYAQGYGIARPEPFLMPGEGRRAVA